MRWCSEEAVCLASDGVSLEWSHASQPYVLQDVLIVICRKLAWCLQLGFSRPLERKASWRSNKKCNALSRCRMPELFTEIDHFSWELGANVQQNPVVGVCLPKRKTIGQSPGHVYLKPVAPQYACPQALPKFGSANEKDPLCPTEFMRSCGSPFHTKPLWWDIFSPHQHAKPSTPPGGLLTRRPGSTQV